MGKLYNVDKDGNVILSGTNTTIIIQENGDTTSLNEHIEDTTIHFDLLGEVTDVNFASPPSSGEGLVFDGNEWINQDVATQTEIDAHVNDTSIHFDLIGEISDVNFAGPPSSGEGLVFDGNNWVNADMATEVELQAHLSDTANPHSTLHSELSDKGTNTHAQIDSHISSTDVHFLQSSISVGPDQVAIDDDEFLYFNTSNTLGIQYDSSAIQLFDGITPEDNVIVPNGNSLRVRPSTGRARLQVESLDERAILELSATNDGSQRAEIRFYNYNSTSAPLSWFWRADNEGSNYDFKFWNKDFASVMVMHQDQSVDFGGNVVMVNDAQLQLGSDTTSYIRYGIESDIIEFGSSTDGGKDIRMYGGIEADGFQTESGNSFEFGDSPNSTELKHTNSRLEISNDPVWLNTSISAPSYYVGSTAGATGTFLSNSSEVVTVVNGIITSIV